MVMWLWAPHNYLVFLTHLYAENSGNSTPTTPNLEAVLAENNSANNQQIKDLQDPTEAQDARQRLI